MPFTLTMPKLSPTMEIGTIAKWHKKVGDKVEAGDLILEVATDKATVEHQALDEGWLRKILVKEGEEAIINQPIAILSEDKAESIEGYKPEGDEGPTEAEEEGKEVEQKDGKKEPEVKQVKEASKISEPLFVPEAPLENYEFEAPVDILEKKIKASPLAKKLSRDLGLDLSTVRGSGPGGRIVKEDLDKAQKSGIVVFGSRARPEFKPGSYEEEKLSPVRKVIAQRMQQSKSFVPHFYVTQTIDAEPLVKMREQLSVMGIKISYNDIVVRAAALALRQHPGINSGFNTANQTIIRFKTIDISIAVNTEGGLITPIVRHADFKNLGEISLEIRSLAKKAKDGKLAPEEYKGGSFTISNLGMHGVTDFQAIINPPQAAILAVSGIHCVPVVKNGTVVPGKTMNLSVSVDHRVIDGVAAAEFIKTVQKYLENPSALAV